MEDQTRLDGSLLAEREIWNASAERQTKRFLAAPTPSFDEWMHRRPEYEFFADFLRSHPDKSAPVLQLGAVDPWCQVLSDVGYTHIIVTDLSDAAVKLAEQRQHKFPKPARYEFVPADAHHLPLADESIGLVIAGGVLHHLRRPEAINELYRVLMPGGRAMLLDYYLDGPLRLGLLTRLWRGSERGNDLPLTYREVELVERTFGTMDRSFFGFRTNIVARFDGFRRGRYPLEADFFREWGRRARADMRDAGRSKAFGRFLCCSVNMAIEKTR